MARANAVLYLATLLNDASLGLTKLTRPQIIIKLAELAAMILEQEPITSSTCVGILRESLNAMKVEISKWSSRDRNRLVT